MENIIDGSGSLATEDPEKIGILIIVADLQTARDKKEKFLVQFIKDQAERFTGIYDQWQKASDPRTGEKERSDTFNNLDQSFDNHIKDYTEAISQYKVLDSRIKLLEKERERRLRSYGIALDATPSEVREALRVVKIEVQE